MTTDDLRKVIREELERYFATGKPPAASAEPTNGTCKKCGAPVVRHYSAKKQRWYSCNSSDRRDFHNCEGSL